MNEEIDESEFYHQDFTTASEWEIFIARIEEIVNQWKTDDIKNQAESNTAGIWSIKSENLTFIDFEFTLSHHRKLVEHDESPKNKNVFDSCHDFELFDPKTQSPHSCLSKWYGLDEFIVLSSCGNAAINNESRIKILLSSIYVAALNLKYEIPMFVQIREKWQQCYLGVYECDTIRTNLEMAHLKYCPRLCQYLSGLLEMFRSKIVSPLNTTTIIVSLQSSYVLKDFGNAVWKQEYINPESDHFTSNCVSALPFGVSMDPIESIVLKATWSQVNHRSMRDSEVHSDFNPMNAHKWSCLINKTDQPICLLAECLEEFLNVASNTSTMYDILGDFATPPEVSHNPLDLLTEPKVPTISTLLSRAARNSLTKPRNKGSAPISEDILICLLYFLFPDADEESSFAYKEFSEPSSDLDRDCRGFKTCPVDSLPWRLAIVLGHALHSLGGLRAMAHVWYEFGQEMRYRWEKNIPIPGLLSGYPDLRTSLLHQKLQMLNCCIERKNSRENSSSSGQHFDSAENSSGEESDDEEFFDCEEELKKRTKHSLWNQPVGRLGKFNNLQLLQTGDPLYIPITQEPVPKTEDQLEEDTDVLLKLGSDAEGSELRAKMMSASLLSDMESFKAANPGSILEDFIRWYSPRDWIEDDSSWGGHLSGRMTIEDNVWLQTWQNAKPVASHRQKRLFDDTREAEKVLHFFDSRNTAQICELLLPILSHAAIYRLHEELHKVHVKCDDIPAKLQSLLKYAERISRETKVAPKRYESFVQEVAALELKLSQVLSLVHKFNPTDAQTTELIAELMADRESVIEGKFESNFGKRLAVMLSEAQRVANVILAEAPVDDSRKMQLPKPAEREMVMRVSLPRPATYSQHCPQFLRAVLKKDDFRLVGAFSEDTVFF